MGNITRYLDVARVHASQPRLCHQESAASRIPIESRPDKPVFTLDFRRKFQETRRASEPLWPPPPPREFITEGRLVRDVRAKRESVSRSMIIITIINCRYHYQSRWTTTKGQTMEQKKKKETPTRQHIFSSL